MTAQPSHDAENITYTYQWYKDGQLLEGQTQSTLTVSENGSYTVKVTAADGKNTTDAIEGQPLVIAIQEHIAGSEWKSDENNHWHECTVCGDKLGEEAHDFEWVIDKEATKTETGSKHEECSVCGFEKPAVDIPCLLYTSSKCGAIYAALYYRPCRKQFGHILQYTLNTAALLKLYGSQAR